MQMTKTYPKSLHRGHWLDNEWLQLAIILVFGVCAPPLMWFGLDFELLTADTGLNSLMASGAAALISWYCLEQLRYFAKVRRLSYVLPVNFFAFGATAAVIGVLRLPYSLAVFLLAFSAVLAISYFIAAMTRKSHSMQWLVAGGAIDELGEGFGAGPMAMLSMHDLKSQLAAGNFSGSIVADLHHPHSAEVESLLAEAAINGVPVYHYRLLLELQTGQVRIDHMRENILGSLIPNLAYMGVKRAYDMCLVVVLALFILPVMAVVAIIIKMDSKGSVFFHQKRVGYRGKIFVMHKFRTMHEREMPKDASGRVDDAITRSGDSRITDAGHFLRKTRLDELPQMLNVLKGEMSWVGPRPEAESLSEVYQTSIPFYRYRHIVRPGISGWAQVNQGHVAEVDEITEKLRFDFYYVRNVSLWLDMLIALKTFRVITSGFGAK